jgi:hypothetical protein
VALVCGQRPQVTKTLMTRDASGSRGLVWIMNALAATDQAWIAACQVRESLDAGMALPPTLMFLPGCCLSLVSFAATSLWITVVGPPVGAYCLPQLVAVVLAGQPVSRLNDAIQRHELARDDLPHGISAFHFGDSWPAQPVSTCAPNGQQIGSAPRAVHDRRRRVTAAGDAISGYVFTMWRCGRLGNLLGTGRKPRWRAWTEGRPG